ncbi:DUF2065 domain-containing protein [Legionella sp. W05-934-2]|jgi:uncharacterized protein YjeT (DUF2065 family)|uniref:DUF2065 domain-containing protein n=1 Tax=Legionella sp. W05-934-2 TaxID=1198649 RepID=UPI003461CCD3
MLIDFLSAIALVFVIEGMLPFISPSKWRSNMLRLSLLNQDTIRKAGLISMVFGVVLLTIVHHI